MMAQLINNRTYEDVRSAEKIIAKVQSGAELTESEWESYFNGLRGAYNITDVNRVMSALRLVADEYNKHGYEINIEPWEDLKHDGIFDVSDWEKYLTCIRQFREATPFINLLPQVPDTLFALDAYKRANDIETIIMDAETYITQMIKAYYFLNEIEVGEI